MGKGRSVDTKKSRDNLHRVTLKMYHSVSKSLNVIRGEGCPCTGENLNKRM